MIPERTHEALINGGIGHIGSANADLKTTHTETFGASLDNDNNCVTCFVLSILAEPILENLKEKGRISFFFGLPSHEAYQFKGQFLETREITEEELANSLRTQYESFKKAYQEAAKPDYIDLDKDGNKTEPMKKAAKDKEDKENK